MQEKIENTDQTLFLQKLINNNHLSPVEHISFTFGIEGVSRSLSHQLVRHRIGASYSQQSQRYVEEKQFDYIIPDSFTYSKELPFGKAWFAEKMSIIQSWYNEAIKAGIPKEEARALLPNACETKLMLTMNARELLHFFKVRCCNKSQTEIRELANQMLVLCKEKSSTIFGSAGASCINGDCQEGKMSCGKPQKKGGVVWGVSKT